MAKTANSLLKRWVTGLVLAPFLVLIIVFGSEEIFTALVTFFIIAGVWEYNHMVFGKGFVKEKTEGLILALVIPLVVLFGNSQHLLAVLALSVVIVFIIFVLSIKESKFDVLSVFKVIFGMLYIPFLMSYFISLRIMDKGIEWIFFVLFLAFIGDIFALYAGKYFGKHKLVPFVSPGKTVEGLAGLVLGSTSACLIFSYYFLPEIPLTQVAILAVTGSIIGQLGDICESAIKRNYGVKDAGSILPGHGGILDRLDCLIFIAPYVYYYRVFIIG
ncbi:phosphatidate cytidylyltransferase [hydrocarbon metagenome]|uniref:Phosphatidate cytidylyltransferase n=1 Tax=hydrocarbon metagenome TaxID=938273 RepID=A0A0W8FUH6_9ZZZZ